MNPNSTFTASSTRRRIFEELEKIAADPTYTTTITHHGRPLAVIISYEEYSRWQETIATAADPLLVREKGEVVYRVRHATQAENSQTNKSTNEQKN